MTWTSGPLGSRATANAKCDASAFQELRSRTSLQRRESHGHHHHSKAFVALLRACAQKKDLYKGTRVHSDILKMGLLEQSSSALVSMYATCGATLKANELLKGLPVRDVYSWNALVAAYAKQGQGDIALNCFERMQLDGISPTGVTFACILKACGSIGDAKKGEKIHDEITRKGLLLGEDAVLSMALVDMYARSGALSKARQVLDWLPIRDVFSWTALITGYARQGKGEDALVCFECMQDEGLSLNVVTFVSIAKACGSIGATDKGEQIYDEIVRRELLSGKDIVLGNALVDMFAKCGALGKAQQVLEELPARDVISWNALIAGYAQHGQGEETQNCFERMQGEGLSPDVISWNALILGLTQQGKGQDAWNCFERMYECLSPNAATFACILKACGSIGAADKGEQIHDEISRRGLLGNNTILGVALVDMYAKCSDLAKAQQVLMELHARDAISWNALITAYVQQGQDEDALECFEWMQQEGLPPDVVTFVCILRACGSIGAAEKGGQIHDEIARQGLLGKDIVLGSSLVDMYAKCGALVKAARVLDALPVPNIFSWTALITGYAEQGKVEDALNSFEQMQCEGLSPNAVTFSCMLNAFSHSGLVDNGQICFANMSTGYGIQPDLEHYTCMVDLFGRAGLLDKALAVIRKMPSPDYCVVWHALLAACWKWQDVTVGRWAFERAVQVDKSDPAAYILMSNIYTAAGMQEDAENIETMRLENKAWKNSRCNLCIDGLISFDASSSKPLTPQSINDIWH